MAYSARNFSASKPRNPRKTGGHDASARIETIPKISGGQVTRGSVETYAHIVRLLARLPGVTFTVHLNIYHPLSETRTRTASRRSRNKSPRSVFERRVACAGAGGVVTRHNMHSSWLTRDRSAAGGQAGVPEEPRKRRHAASYRRHVVSRCVTSRHQHCICYHTPTARPVNEPPRPPMRDGSFCARP